jgi:serine protease inhibitor
VYFRASWANPFAKPATHDEDFNAPDGSTRAAMMKQTALPFSKRDADFSGMTDEDQLFLAKVIQKAFIAADEKGTEAAAVTAVVISVPQSLHEHVELPKEVVFHADHPLLYILRHRETGVVLFIGRVTQPSWGESRDSATP